MKPTLDEEITRIAEDAARDLGAFTDPEIRVVDSAIRAGIEAWKRQEPSLEILNAANERMWEEAKPLRQGTVEFELWLEVYRAMMSASTKECNDKS